jgi:hypothetical protein
MRYQWQLSNSAIQEIIFSGGKKAPMEAVIFAPADANAVAGLDKALAAKGMHVSYDVIDNRAALRVGGFTNEQDVLGLLKQNNLIGGEAKTEELATEKRPFDKFIGAAIFYQIGNVLGFIGNLLRKDRAGMMSDGFFITGDTTMLAFGRKSVEEKQIALMQGFGNVLKQNGIGVEAGSAFAPRHTQDLTGAWNSFRRFMADKVVGIKAASEVGAGLKKVQAGINQGNSAKSVAGALIASGFAAGALIPEKTLPELRDEYGAKDDDELKSKIAALPLGKRILTSIQRTPLILSGLFSGLNNIFSVLGAIDEKKYFEKKEKETGVGESRKQTEIKAQLSTTGVGEYQKSVFGVKTVDVKLNDNDTNPKLWTASGKLAKANAAYDTVDKSDVDATSKALAAKYAAEHNILDLQADQKRLESGRFGVAPQKLWIFDVAQSVAFFIGNILYANSPKGGNMFDRAMLSERFFAAVTTQIATAPADQKDYLFAAACQYAGDTRDLGVTVREAQKIIGDKLKQIEANPWLKHRDDAPAPAIAATEAAPEKSPAIGQAAPSEERHEQPNTTSFVEKHAPNSAHGYTADLTRKEHPTMPTSLMERALAEAPAASNAIH